MKRVLTISVFFLFSSWVMASSLSGRWTVLHDHTSQKKAEVMLKESGGVLSGYFLEVLGAKGPLRDCAVCEGSLKNKPFYRMPLLWALTQQAPGVWSGGSMLDFETGRVYRVKLKQVGDKLYVRHYVGTSLLGHTQIWVR